MPLLPKYALGNWWSRFYKYTEQTYRDLIETFEAEKIPFTVSVLDMDWHLVNIDPKYGSGWTGYTWNKEFFPDPQGFMCWLHQKGLKITLNLHPADGVRAHEEMYMEMAKAMDVAYENETPIPFDVTDRAFLEAYFKYLHHPNEGLGVDFWWIDWQQGSQSKIKDLDPLWMLNHFHYLDHGRDGKRPMIFSRYSGIGSHRYPIGFSGDSIISWDSLAFQPYFTANASNVGYGWWSHDIGGHMRGIKNDELSTRWLQFGVFSPIMRLHSSASVFLGKEPWRYGKKAHEIMNGFLRLRHQMLPYLYAMNARCSFEGAPLIQPMYYHYPEVNEAYEVPNQYFFGSELIVSPITIPTDPQLLRAGVKVWLPEGTLFDYFTGVRYCGDRWITMYRALDNIPVLAKAGAIVPMLSENFRGNDLSNPTTLEIRIYGGADGQFNLYEDDGESMAYKQGASVQTNMRLDWHMHHQFKIAPGKGSVELIPSHRNYQLKLVGIRDCDAIRAYVKDIEIPFQKSYDLKMNTIQLQIDHVSVQEELLIQFEEKPTLAENNLKSMAYDFLEQAQIAFDLKDELYGIMTLETTAIHKMARLQVMNLDNNLLGILSEMIQSTQ